MAVEIVAIPQCDDPSTSPPECNSAIKPFLPLCSSVRNMISPSPHLASVDSSLIWYGLYRCGSMIQSSSATSMSILCKRTQQVRNSHFAERLRSAELITSCSYRLYSGSDEHEHPIEDHDADSGMEEDDHFNPESASLMPRSSSLNRTGQQPQGDMRRKSSSMSRYECSGKG